MESSVLDESSQTLFAQTEGEITTLQRQILGQSQAIEEFIRVHSKEHKKSESFGMLTTLFNMFKTELSMNLGLRRTILVEKAQHHQFLCDLADMLDVSDQSEESIAQAVRDHLNREREASERCRSCEESEAQCTLELQEQKSKKEKIKRERDEFKAKYEEIKVTVGEIERELGKEYPSLKAENARLNSQLKAISRDFQSVEAENARLTVTVEKLEKELQEAKEVLSVPSDERIDTLLRKLRSYK